jgi:DNA-binding transcriptional ArsR family regulator
LGGSGDAKNIQTVTMRTVIAMILETDPQFEIERKKILRRGAGQFGVYDLDAVIEHLLQAGMLKIEKRGQGTYYKLTEVVLKRHRDESSKGTSA